MKFEKARKFLALGAVLALGAGSWAAERVEARSDVSNHFFHCPARLPELASVLQQQEQRLEKEAAKLPASAYESLDLDTTQTPVLIELLAPFALPEALPFREVHLQCWADLRGFRDALKTESDAASPKLWLDCLKSVYRTTPKAASEIVSCFDRLKAKRGKKGY